MVVRPVAVGRGQIRGDGVCRSGRVALERAALAYALVGLDVRASRDFLQKDLDRFGTGCAFEGERAGRLGHRHFLGLLFVCYLFVVGGAQHSGSAQGADFITRICRLRVSRRLIKMGQLHDH